VNPSNYLEGVPSQTRKRIPRAEREQRMLAAAEEVFSRGPYRDSSMDEIAALSGITKPLLYKYFGSKEGLFEAAADRALSRIFAAIEEEARAVPPGPERITAFAERYVDAVAENRSTWWLLYSGASPEAVSAMRQRNVAVIRGLLADTFAETGLPVEHKQLDLLASTLVGAGEGMARWWDENPQVARDELKGRFLTIVTGAITAVAGDAVKRRDAEWAVQGSNLRP
jgi:AcrR family transcriptional regulator